MKHLVILLLVFLSVSCRTQNELYTYATPLSEEAKKASIQYTISTPKPETHYAEVTLEIKNYSKEYIDFKLPVWAPGSYLIREFPRFVDFFEASHAKSLLRSEKIAKNTWRVYSKNKENITIKYQVYCNELSVRTSFVDDSHAYFNGTSVFMYVDDLLQKEGTLTIVPHESFKKIATSLEKTGKNTFQFINYDYLVDAPIEIGNHEEFEFKAGGTLHRVAMYGKANYDIEKLKTDMAKVCEAATDVFGENPNRSYQFIIHNLTVGSGGLEHLNSTTLQVSRDTYNEENYTDFLSLVAHEYFHLWNVKRIRPMALGPFDYEKENYTHLLWVMEGFTSYYEGIILYKAGFYNEEDLINKTKGRIGYIENTPGNKVQSATEASFDAWIKAYRPHENSANTCISYYPKGATLAQVLDFDIIEATKGEKNLDDVMQYLYQEYAKERKRGFTDEEFQAAVELIAGKSFRSFFQNNVFQPKKVDYASSYKHVGLNFKEEIVSSEDAYLGAQLRGNLIASVIIGKTAYESGLNANDYILKVGDDVAQNNVIELIKKYRVGKTVNFTVSRDNIERIIPVTFITNNTYTVSITPMDNLSPEQVKNKQTWLRK